MKIPSTFKIILLYMGKFWMMQIPRFFLSTHIVRYIKFWHYSLKCVRLCGTELQRVKQLVIKEIKGNRALEEDLDTMDVKIGLLIKNRITLQVRTKSLFRWEQSHTAGKNPITLQVRTQSLCRWEPNHSTCENPITLQVRTQSLYMWEPNHTSGENPITLQVRTQSHCRWEPNHTAGKNPITLQVRTQSHCR